MIGFLLDMDGVIYRGSELIPGADRFVSRLRRYRCHARKSGGPAIVFRRQAQQGDDANGTK